jgi:hypothetical protein
MVPPPSNNVFLDAQNKSESMSRVCTDEPVKYDRGCKKCGTKPGQACYKDCQ